MRAAPGQVPRYAPGSPAKTPRSFFTGPPPGLFGKAPGVLSPGRPRGRHAYPPWLFLPGPVGFGPRVISAHLLARYPGACSPLFPVPAKPTRRLSQPRQRPDAIAYSFTRAGALGQS